MVSESVRKPTTANFDLGLSRIASVQLPVNLITQCANPVSWENGDPLKWGPPKMGTPGPHFSGRMGTRVPIFPVKWGPGSPSSQENGDPGSPFYREDGDPIGKMGTPSVADHFLGIEGSNPALL